jgi:hypothetical protein
VCGGAGGGFRSGGVGRGTACAGGGCAGGFRACGAASDVAGGVRFFADDCADSGVAHDSAAISAAAKAEERA